MKKLKAILIAGILILLGLSAILVFKTLGEYGSAGPISVSEYLAGNRSQISEEETASEIEGEARLDEESSLAAGEAHEEEEAFRSASEKQGDEGYSEAAGEAQGDEGYSGAASEAQGNAGDSGAASEAQGEEGTSGLEGGAQGDVGASGIANEAGAEKEADPGEALLQELIEKQSLERKISQLFVPTPEALTGVDQVIRAGDGTRKSFEEFPVSGIIYMGSNLKNPDQTREMLSNMSAFSRDILGLPVFLCVDEEGGTVARIAKDPSFGVKNVGDMLDIGKTGDIEKAREAGEYVGDYLSGLGFNVDFAPVADIITVSGNKLMEKRAFGSDKDLVCDMTRAFSDGLLSQGVFSCAKHFPGHGNTTEDSHKGYAVSRKTLQELRETELAPFKAEIDAGIPMIMVGHISLPEVTGDMTPSSLSPVIVQDLLRGELGYENIVITDAMNMGAIANNYPSGEAAVRAIEAGCDLLLAVNDIKGARQALLKAVDSGKIKEERIDESLRRIYRVKLKLAGN
ncbi:MAG: glycoside hydrolase family 3 protein [Lachnospiraceae bacterium]|nr:glycoside hydrolase family 3 protein [Lachnospiraceae bacterium]